MTPVTQLASGTAGIAPEVASGMPPGTGSCGYHLLLYYPETGTTPCSLAGLIYKAMGAFPGSPWLISQPVWSAELAHVCPL